MTRAHTLFLTVAVLALALTGTATAAKLLTGKNIRDSSLTGRDVKNATLTGKDLRDGSVAAADLAPDLRGRLVGAGGSGGASGAAGKNGPAGATGAQGAPGTPGAKGDGFDPAAALASGQTLRGVWSTTDEGTYATLGVSYQQRLGFTPRLGSTGTKGYGKSADCPGTAAEPVAAPGALCLYTGYDDNLSSLNAKFDTAPRYGFVIEASQPTFADAFRADGSWAVTAP